MRSASTSRTACGFPNPERAASVRGLRQILEHPTGKTVMTTIQKFQEITSAGGAAGRATVHPTLSEAANIFVMVDEAHRTQYQSLAANMRQALPNACFLGFTGTPIDKKDRSTLQTFGPYIDTYTIEQAVQDRATVPIFYESRLPELQIIGQTIDQVFDRVFAGRSDDERAAIKRRFATEQAIVRPVDIPFLEALAAAAGLAVARLRVAEGLAGRPLEAPAAQECPVCRCLTEAGEPAGCDCGLACVETEVPKLLSGKFRLLQRNRSAGAPITIRVQHVNPNGPTAEFWRLASGRSAPSRASRDSRGDRPTRRSTDGRCTW